MLLCARRVSVAVLSLGVLATPEIALAGPASPGCPGDVSTDGVVNVADLLAVIGRWGQVSVTHDITVGATFTFSPNAINAKSGDSVRWTRQSGAHTTTSGSGCVSDGLFNSALNVTTPQFTFPIPSDFVGEIPFFCTPHCPFGMTGNITVGPFWEDLNANGVVNVQDLLGVIGGWGTCG